MHISDPRIGAPFEVKEGSPLLFFPRLLGGTFLPKSRCGAYFFGVVMPILFLAGTLLIGLLFCSPILLAFSSNPGESPFVEPTGLAITAAMMLVVFCGLIRVMESNCGPLSLGVFYKSYMKEYRKSIGPILLRICPPVKGDEEENAVTWEEFCDAEAAEIVKSADLVEREVQAFKSLFVVSSSLLAYSVFAASIFSWKVGFNFPFEDGSTMKYSDFLMIAGFLFFVISSLEIISRLTLKFVRASA